MKIYHIAATLLLAAAANIVYAAGDSVSFSDQGRQYFVCTVSDPGTSVTLATSGIDAQGFCPGKGTIVLSGSTVNNSFFAVQNTGFTQIDGNPQIIITTTSGAITCKSLGTNRDPNRNEYARGRKFC